MLQAILLQCARAKTGSLHVVSSLAMGGKHDNTQYRPRDEWPCRAPGRFRRGSILSSKVLDARRTLCGKRCAYTLWTNPCVCLSVSYVYLAFLLFIPQLASSAGRAYRNCVSVNTISFSLPFLVGVACCPGRSCVPRTAPSFACSYLWARASLGLTRLARCQPVAADHSTCRRRSGTGQTRSAPGALPRTTRSTRTGWR